jgi:hypothetical protein
MKLESLIRRFRKKCPKCSDGRLRTTNWLRITCVNKEGWRYPDSWTYYRCDRCKCRLKIFINGKTEDPSEEEWMQHCQDPDMV